ncbi:MAG TPA: hypothetical protein VK988_13540 [Acidimicrobiales bacterium]|nr:hypothetical protein [Acidimicrobiales bacterium]
MSARPDRYRSPTQETGNATADLIRCPGIEELEYIQAVVRTWVNYSGVTNDGDDIVYGVFCKARYGQQQLEDAASSEFNRRIWQMDESWASVNEAHHHQRALLGAVSWRHELALESRDQTGPLVRAQPSATNGTFGATPDAVSETDTIVGTALRELAHVRCADGLPSSPVESNTDGGEHHCDDEDGRSCATATPQTRCQKPEQTAGEEEEKGDRPSHPPIAGRPRYE